jgi:hypothetical protein
VRSLYARRVWALVFLPLLAIVVGVWGATGTALAHGHTTVGDYELVIGFHGEPAYQDEPNGLDLFVTNTKTGEKVNGLASTLGAEIIYGTSKKAVQLKPQFGEDGAYTAYVLPTEAVQPKSSVAFPSALPSPSALQQQIDSVNRLAVIALTVGVLGLLAGAGGVYYGLRNRAPTAVSLEAERAAAHNDA